MNTILEARDLTKLYGNQLALDRLNFALAVLATLAAVRRYRAITFD